MVPLLRQGKTLLTSNGVRCAWLPFFWTGPCARAAAPGRRAADCPQTSVGDLEDEVQCLECGVPLQLATESPQANRQRALIGRLVDSCASKDEIKDRLVAEFGPRVLTTPDDEGFDLAAWVVPVAALLAGALAIGFTARRWRRSRRPGPSRAPPRPTAASTPTSSATTCRWTAGSTPPSSPPSRSASSRSSRPASCRSCPATCPRSPAFRSPTSRRARADEGARPRAAVLPGLLGDVRGAGHDRHRASATCSRTTASCCARSRAW